MSNSVEPDETGSYEPSHLDLCGLPKPVAFFNKLSLEKKFIYKVERLNVKQRRAR